MIRRLFLLLLVIVLCLSVCACKKTDNQPTTDTTEQIKATEPTETTQKTEDIKPTEPPATELSVSDWQLEKPDYLSYEEYFSVERAYCGDAFYAPTKWMKGDQVYYLLHLQRNEKTQLEVVCYEPERRYTVPKSFDYDKYYTAGADGRYAYMYNDSQFLRIDLATGEAEVLLTGSSLGIRLVDNLVLYYTSYKDNALTIGRLYLPTLKNDILYKTSGEFYNLALHKPKTNKSPLVWELWNPEFIDFLKAELANPNSKIQKGEDYDFTQDWKREDSFAFVLTSPARLHCLQDTGNQRALQKCTYNLETKQLTQQTGIMDNCWHGSGYPHDHYNTEITTMPAPELIMSDWTKVAMEVQFPLCLPADGEVTRGKIEKLIGVDSQMYLYAKTDGDYKKIVNTPISNAVDTGSCAIYLTADRQSVMAVNYDGTQFVELYRAVHGTIIDIDLGLGKTRLLLQDGDTLVAIDLSSAQYRVVLKHQYLLNYNFDFVYKDEKHIDTDKIYVEMRAGMCLEAYIVDVKTGELKESGFRL